jgi:hypothetical protein
MFSKIINFHRRQVPWDSRPVIFLNWTLAVIQSLCNILSPFTTAADPRQRSRSQVRVLRDSWPHFTASNSALPSPGGLGSRINIPQELVGPVIPPGTGFPFRRLLWLAGPWWRYSIPLPHGFIIELLLRPRYIALARTENKATFQIVPLLSSLLVDVEVCSPCRCLATTASPCSIMPTSSRLVII